MIYLARNIVFAIVFLTFGFAKAQNNESSMNNESISFLALGDSYTIGESVLECERWPIQLSDRLKSQGISIEPVQIIATTGWTTDELQNGIKKASIDGNKYGLVSLLIGVNNQYRGYPIDQYKEQFQQLLNQAIEFADGNTDRVFVVSIPDYGVTPFAKEKDPPKIARELDQYNSIALELARSKGVEFFDITTGSRNASEDSELIASDGLHPSGKMYSEWVDLIEEWAINALR